MTSAGYPLTEAERLWPDLRSDSAEGIAAMLNPPLRAGFLAFTQALDKAGEAFPAISAGTQHIHVTHGALPARAKRRRTALLIQGALDHQARDLGQAEQALAQFRTLVETERAAGISADVAMGLERLTERLEGILHQAQLSHSTAVHPSAGRR